MIMMEGGGSYSPAKFCLCVERRKAAAFPPALSPLSSPETQSNFDSVAVVKVSDPCRPCTQ
jgi:hypothetical protein